MQALTGQDGSIDGTHQGYIESAMGEELLNLHTVVQALTGQDGSIDGTHQGYIEPAMGEELANPTGWDRAIVEHCILRSISVNDYLFIYFISMFHYCLLHHCHQLSRRKKNCSL